MDRIAEKNLKDWFLSKNRKPLVIRGARQVGKSTLVRNFAAQNNLTLHEVNLEKNLKLDAFFKALDIKETLQEIELICDKGKIAGNNSILFLDEIQAVPSAIPALRYFYEEYPEIPLIAAGSLMEFALSRHNFSMPVGRIQYLFIGPMSFLEFLIAKNQHSLIDYVTQFRIGTRPSPTAHEKLIKIFREFLFVGGMPEAVQVFMDTDSFKEVFKVHDAITETYRDDFNKYASHSALLRLQKVFDYAPTSIGEKLKFVNIDPHQQAREMQKAVEMLAKAGIIHQVFHSPCSGLPLQAKANRKYYKLLFLDVGLMNNMRGISVLPTDKITDKKYINEGKAAEQVIGQHLLYTGNVGKRPGLCYWINQGKAGNAEVDYVITVRDLIVPVEVKAGHSGTLKSVMQFCHIKRNEICVRFDLNQPSLHQVQHKIKQKTGVASVHFWLLSLPLYMAAELPRLIEDTIDSIAE